MALQQLWAGWRAQYVAGTTEAERGGAGGPTAPPPCVFCGLAASGPPTVDNLVVWRDDTTMVALNAYPYASGHMLVLPLRHQGTVGGLSAAESSSLWETTRVAIAALVAAYRPDGINMGANLGRAAGAGLPDHLHVHVVPRWSGDTNFMTAVAGVRVLPEPLETAWAKLRAVWGRGAPPAG